MNTSTTMRHLSLFAGSGIGTLAAQSAGIVTVAHAENDPCCCYCLRKLWPDTHLFEDVRHVTADELARQGRLPIDIISGGFPCQDISTAGKGAGLAGQRSGLWFEMARIIRETRPRWVLAENVPALRSRGADRVLADLEAEGYTCWATVVGAWAVGAPHKRDRVWIVAYRGSERCERRQGDASGRDGDGKITGRQQGDDQPAGQDLAGGLDDTDGARCDGTLSDAEGDTRDEARLRVPRERCAGGGELADSDCTRSPLSLCERGDPREEQQTAIGSRWPARPGEQQHAWEATRFVELSLGDATHGLARRLRSRTNKSLLRMAGNGWTYPVAEMMFRAIVELDALMDPET